MSEYLRFSQRNGLEPLPQQLQLGQLSQQFIALVWGAIYSDIQDGIGHGVYDNYLEDRWKSIIYDYCVEVLNAMNPQNISYDIDAVIRAVESKIKSENYATTLDTVEYFLRHPKINPKTKEGVRAAFVRSHLAYRVIDKDTIVAIGTGEQAHAVQSAFSLSSASAPGAFSHLKASASALARNDWATSIRESITAVESAARLVAGDSATLGEALKSLGKSNTINPLLKSALEKLYAYTNAEQGIRHANVFEDKANVDEDDALFMLGACASFVTFLLSKRAAK